ncbi:agrin-like isoform X2 [Argopecten irradians]|uniref:agrin-like isoform X2 n=1 Tax=Argopecten irradians TaxID=31199 RepID=UPI0037174FE0
MGMVMKIKRSLSTKSVSLKNLKSMWIIIVSAGIFQTFFGLCQACYVFPAGSKNPCDGVTCRLGAICVPSKNGLSHRCMCPERCDNYGDNLGGMPVCGTNGKDYNSSCELRRASCRDMKEIKLKYYGKCKPCAGFVCEPPKVCQLASQTDRRPVCRCAETCPDTLKFVCGTDGATYSNLCRLEMEACRTMRDIRLHHSGKCQAVTGPNVNIVVQDEVEAYQGTNPCRKITCGFGQECTINKNGLAKCQCPSPCEPIVQQVCGSDGYTYDNECELRRDSCRQKKNVELFHHGPCGTGEISCRGYTCHNDAICQMRGGQPSCECPVCSEEFEPVCGTDGRTYPNECKLRLTNCDERTSTQIWHQGRCRGCGDQDPCEFYSVCDKSNDSPTCVCPRECKQNQVAKLCGSDGKTYRNECELMLESCRLQQLIIVASIGECELCKGTTCNFGARCENGTCVCPLTCPRTLEPVCASDRKTYENECKMKRAACVQNVDLYVMDNRPCENEVDTVYSGGGSGDTPDDMPVCDEILCKYGGECQLNEQGTYACICNFNCQAVRSPVCGSDGRTYGNLCEMQYEACQEQREISLVSNDDCIDFTEEPCDGNPPLEPPHPFEYTCSSTMNNCPPNSYCHARFGKCCREADCTCYEKGSISITCNPVTRECSCKPGVGGKQCNRCLPGYWGLALNQDSVGCVPCNCHTLGRLRGDCDQSTGKCFCRPKIRGSKCDRCPNGNLIVSRYGCPEDPNVLPIPRTCREVQCGFGGTCVEFDNRAFCDCESLPCFAEDWPRSVTVCGSDLNTYESECELKRNACNQQTNITVVFTGECGIRRRTTPSPIMNGHPRRTPHYRATTPTPAQHERPRSSYKTTRHAGHPPPEASHEMTRTTARPVTNPPPLVEGKILDICLDDTYCSVQNSHCHLGICTCWEGYIPTLDNTHCSEVKQVKPGNTRIHDQSACSINPCRNQGLCVPDDLLGYRCLCPLGKTGPNCKRDARIRVPSFTGMSYMSVTEINKANDDLTIEMSFRSLNTDGLLLFSSQFANGTGDFISITLVDQYVEFRFDLGSGIAIIRSLEKIPLNQDCHVIASRFDREGMLIVNASPGVSQMSPASLVSLDLKGPLYIGFLPEHANLGLERAGVDVGFVGCVMTLQASTSHLAKVYDLTYPQVRPDIYEARDIGECGQNPCSSLPCMHGGTCLMSDAEIFTCLCEEGYSGNNCEIVLNPCVSAVCQHGATCRQTLEGYECVCPDNREGEFCEYEKLHKIFVPEFNGSSYIQCPLGDVSSTALSLKVWFMTRKPNGVLMYASQFSRGLGDFVSVNIVDLHIEFRFNMGSGTVVIRSDEKIEINKWHEVYVQKVDRAGTLVIDSSEERQTMAESQGGLTELNLQERNLFLGGFQNNNTIPADSNILYNFTGVIQRIYINGRLIDNIMEVARDRVNIKEYLGNPCNVNPCLNGGVCVPKLNAADCKCPMKYLGQRCEKRSDAINKDLPVKFDGRTYLRYPNEISHQVPGQRTNKYTIKFRETRGGGLILFQQGTLPVLDDYFAIAVVDGSVELSYNLGGQTEEGLHIIRSTVAVDDGLWHTLVANRDERQATLQVDDERPVKGMSSEGASQLDTDGNLWIGGKSSLPLGLPDQYYHGFRGCIEEVYINGRKLQMIDHRSDQRSPIVRFCV